MATKEGAAPRTLFDKIWQSHLVERQADGTCILYIDRHLVHEVTSPQAFEGLRASGRKVRRPDATLAVPDHNVPTTDRSKGILEEESRIQVETLEANCKEFGVPLIPVMDVRQGIVHIIGPEQGFTLPGTTLVCGDSHTATHGAFGALAFGIGTSEVEHVLATQTLVQKPAKNMRVTVTGALSEGCTAKDLILAIIGRIGVDGGTGHVIEYRGDAIAALDMDARMTVCNMSIEAGARAGMIAPDEVTYEYLAGRPRAPHGAEWQRALERWRTLPSDAGARFDREVAIDAARVEPMISYGTNPGMVMPIGAAIPERPDDAAFQRALTYMGLSPGQPLRDQKVNVVFVGSCTNARLSDLREAARLLRGRHIARGIRMLVVPGSQQIKRQAETEGLDRVFTEAGAEWRESGCSMCIGMNGDTVARGEYSVSTSNRNFEGRQGAGARTLLASPLTAAACAVTGRVTDPRELVNG